MNVLTIELAVLWCTAGLYLVSGIIFVYSMVFRKEHASKQAMFIASAGLVLHSVALLMRWGVSGHLPYTKKYEIYSLSVWTTILFFVTVGWRRVKLRVIGIVIIPLSLLVMAISLSSNPTVNSLSPSLRGIWFHIHAISNALTAGASILAVGTSIIFIIKENKEAHEFYKKIPSLDVLDEYAYKFGAFGFIFWSLTVISGAIWANNTWGRYWAWDPIETWSLVTWFMFGLYLHVRHFFKWRGRKAALLLCLCFISSVFGLVILPLFLKSIHSSYFM
jgi:cytochrome c-type biogenesis protein CcsB